ncbi:MAG TPA: hypothetical protein VFD71_18615 [Planctomycetota bacterium]|jgi:hypothetical protein|nr:hypothetical protein [Planctomycetota bacterium]
MSSPPPTDSSSPADVPAAPEPPDSTQLLNPYAEASKLSAADKAPEASSPSEAEAANSPTPTLPSRAPESTVTRTRARQRRVVIVASLFISFLLGAGTAWVERRARAPEDIVRELSREGMTLDAFEEAIARALDEDLTGESAVLPRASTR